MTESPKKKFSLVGLSSITFLLLGLMNFPLRYAAQVGSTSLTTGGEPGAGTTRFMWVLVDVIRLLQLAVMGVFVFAVVRGIGRRLSRIGGKKK